MHYLVYFSHLDRGRETLLKTRQTSQTHFGSSVFYGTKICFCLPLSHPELVIPSARFVHGCSSEEPIKGGTIRPSALQEKNSHL